MTNREGVTLPLKRVLSSLRDGTHGTFERVSSGVPLLSAKNINSGKVDVTDEESCISWSDFESIHRSGYLRLGDILLTIVGSIGNVAVYDYEGPCAFQRSVAVLRPKDRVYNRFLFYLLSSPEFQTELAFSVKTSAQGGVYLEDLGEIQVTVPNLDTQRAIADYLDRETARLDALVAAKERVLGLLAEKRRAIITHAVTRGLNPDAPLRDSGVPWLGEIPALWETRRIAWLFRERDERGEPDLPLLEVSINAGVVLREFSEERIESTAADFNTYKVARRGDIVFNKMRMWQGAVGVAPEDGLVSPDYVVAAPTGPLLSEYAGLLFRTSTFSAECARRSHGIVWDRLRLYWEGFRDIEVPLSSLDQQSGIVAHAASETAELDALSASTERTMALLKERRGAVIAAAVTGRMGLRTGGRVGVEAAAAVVGE